MSQSDRRSNHCLYSTPLPGIIAKKMPPLIRGLFLCDTSPQTELAGDQLRKTRKFREAIASYRDDLDSGALDIEAQKEAKYNIGLCRISLGEYTEAKMDMKALIRDHGDDGNARAYAAYCLAWIDVQEGSYTDALAKLNAAFDSGTVSDTELKARILLKTGKIHLAWLNDFETARTIFKRVAAEFPNTKMAEHPYVTDQMQ